MPNVAQFRTLQGRMDFKVQLIVIFGIAIGVVENLPCFNHNVTACHSHITCTNNDVLVCELDTCSCGSPCLAKSDCSACTDVVDLAGHVIHMDQHCVDGGCDCLPVPHNDGGHNGPPPPPGK